MSKLGGSGDDLAGDGVRLTPTELAQVAAVAARLTPEQRKRVAILAAKLRASDKPVWEFEL